MAAGTGADIANRKARIRPRDASALLLIDRSGDEPRVLVGKRSTRHAFMPDLYVFPGGRRDAADNRTVPASDFHPATRAMLKCSLPKHGEARLRGLGICALRELGEETGLAARGLAPAPDLALLRYVARAITPPGGVRRYDTQFFACFSDELGISPDDISDSDELSDLRFIRLTGEPDVRMPDITQLILGELHSFVVSEPSLRFGQAVPWYLKHGGRHIRRLIEESETQ